MPSIDEVLERARRRFIRLEAVEAAAEQAGGAILVDTRTESQRAAQAGVPGALVIDRTVLEWRLDPRSPHRVPQATDHSIRVIVMCAEGYSSSLAAASLQDLGLVNATDVVGGFEAWAAAGLPIERPAGRKPTGGRPVLRKNASAEGTEEPFLRKNGGKSTSRRPVLRKKATAEGAEGPLSGKDGRTGS